MYLDGRGVLVEPPFDLWKPAPAPGVVAGGLTVPANGWSPAIDLQPVVDADAAVVHVELLLEAEKPLTSRGTLMLTVGLAGFQTKIIGFDELNSFKDTDATPPAGSPLTDAAYWQFDAYRSPKLMLSLSIAMHDTPALNGTALYHAGDGAGKDQGMQRVLLIARARTAGATLGALAIHSEQSTTEASLVAYGMGRR